MTDQSSKVLSVVYLKTTIPQLCTPSEPYPPAVTDQWLAVFIMEVQKSDGRLVITAKHLSMGHSQASKGN